MKNKRKIENKKLFLYKETVTILNKKQAKQIYGGGTTRPGGPPDTATFPPPGGTGTGNGG